MDTPNFIESITDPRLRDAALAVWGRLPEPARGVLEALAPVIVVMPDKEFPRPDAWGTTATDPSGQPSILLRASLTNQAKVIGRYIVAHELSHLVLRHHDFTRIASLAQLSQQEREITHMVYEEHADYLLAQWNFDGELNAMEDNLLRHLRGNPRPGAFVARTRWQAGLKMMEAKQHGMGRMAEKNV